ncbi:MAG: hypothetical protein PWR27_1653 [Petroclostridium sp.]|nr:hypothetical protein [Petroclostridium sp.]
MVNYVIYTDGFNEMERIIFLDLEGMENVKIVSKNRVFNNSFAQKLFRLHFSFKINNKFDLPLKSIWFKKLYKTFPNNDETIYLFSPSWYYPQFFEYIRKANTSNKIAMHFGDTIISKKRFIKNLDIEYLKKNADYIGSYNPRDVCDYNIDYLNMCYSKFNNISELPQYDKVDVVFVGAARNRMNLIMEAYKNAKKAGLKVWFYIVSDNSELESGNDIFFSKSPLSYREYLGHVISSKCIVEIIDPGSDGGTLRFWDAVMYNKKLITNNKSILDSKYYDGKNIVFTCDYTKQVFESIDIQEGIDYHYLNENSPIEFIKHIEDEIRRKKQ